MTIEFRHNPLSPRADACSPTAAAARARLAVVALLMLFVAGAGPLEEIRVRLPAEKVGTFFPAGTELRGLPLGEYEALLKAAREGHRRQAGPPAPRLLRARHEARWEEGRLVGRSELLAECVDPESRELVLAPWTPAVDPPDDAASALRMHDDGRTAIRFDSAGPSTAHLRWQLVARANSQGRSFLLGMPATETSSLALDLPDGWVPEGPEGVLIGPSPGAGPDRKTWRFEGRGGLVELAVRPRDAEMARDRRAWLSGATRVELEEASARWTMEGSVAFDPRGPRRLTVDLNKGLEFLDATGPDVQAARTAANEGRTRVSLLFGGSGAAPTAVAIRAIARAPVDGPWTIPAALPVDAYFTGGRTTVRLDASRVVRDCRDLAGRRIASRPGDAADANLFVFEPHEPGPVAELVFARPRADVSVEVRGQLLLGNAAPRLECQLTWRVHRGRLLALDFDLPPAWVPERISGVGIDETLAWHPSDRAGGGVRVHVAPPSGDFARNSLRLNVAATASIAGGPGPIMLPRVRPVSGQVIDERWLAWTESGVTLHTESARGLAWIDPSLVIGATSERPDSPAGLREALAWRWIAEQAEARVERDRAPSEPSGSVELLATVERDRLRLDWTITVNPGDESLRAIPIAVVDPIGGEHPWTFTDEATALELPRRPLDGARRAELKFPQSSEAWELAIAESGTGPVVIRSRLEVPWRGEGRLPLLALPERFRCRNVVAIDVARNLRARADAAELIVLDRGIVGKSAGIAGRAETSRTDPSAPRRDFAFGYAKPGGRLELRTETLEPALTEGVIDQAVLTTTFDPQGPRRQRLALRVAIADATALELRLPAGSTLVRVRRDGQSITPARSGRGLSLPLTASSSSRHFCSFVLDYMTPFRPGADGRVLRPDRPWTSLPCLALRWEVVAPRPWSVVGHGPRLTAADPERTPGILGGILDPWQSEWTAAATGRSRRDVEMLRWLDARVAEVAAGEMTLGEWLTRWDIGRWPLVVDRMALETAGWGPRSRVAPPRVDASRPGSASAALVPLGLALVPLGDSILITTRAETPDRPGGPLADRATAAEWETRLREATVWGSDAADRFQSVMRWRGELTPKSGSSSDVSEFEPAGEGWQIWRFASSGWPEDGLSVELGDVRTAAAWGWAAAFAVVAAGLGCRRLAPRTRALVLSVGLLVVLLAAGAISLAGRPVVSGALGGGLALLFFWAGRLLPRRQAGRSREARTASWVPRRPSRSSVAGLVLVSVAAVAAGSRAQNVRPAPDAAAPIVALCPFEGVPDPDRAPDRVVLRLDDYHRLKTLATADPPAPPVPVAALSATHRVSLEGEDKAVIESDIELLCDGSGHAAWTFPVGRARDLAATLDGATAPIVVRPGAETASVPIDAKGRTRLRLRRVATLARDADVLILSLPINSLASARIDVSPGPAARRAIVATARGAIEPQGRGVAGTLGPTDRLEVRWEPRRRESARTAPAAAGAVEGLLLWDAEPAGDRLRARLTYRNPKGTAAVRLVLEPGLIVRSSRVPGLVDVVQKPSERGSEWIASVDPPLPDGGVIRLELWRPIAGGRDLPERTLPRVEPLDAESYKGAVGFRRPADWLGRMAPGAGGETMTEELFVRSWGTLPEEPLTLSGATRYAVAPVIAVRTAPPPARQSVRSDVSLELGPGRIEMSTEATLVQESGRSYAVELEVPAALVVTRVDAEGMTDWTRAAERLVVRFDGAASKQRLVRVQGWLPVPYDPLATGPATQDVDVPWPRWLNAESSGATLHVEGPSSFRLEAAAGATPLPPTSGDSAPTRPGRVRKSYRVDRSNFLGRLRWNAEPPRVDVQVRSQLTIHPDSAEWVATLRFDVSGGACDTLLLKLPTAWAAAAEVTMVGERHTLSSESHGATTALTIRPRHPIWGTERVVVRSTRPIAGRGSLLFPDLVPTVQGTVETYLALVNASGREVVPEGSPGVQPIDDGTRFQAEEFWPMAGLPTSIYRVRAEGWSLNVEVPNAASTPEHGQARVRLGAIECNLESDGAALGSLRCEVEPGSAPFLPVTLPAGSIPLWASVNDGPVRPLRTASGTWLVPVDGRGPSELVLVWSAPAGSARGLGLVPLPTLDPQGLPLFVSVRAPVTLTLTGENSALEASTPDAQDLAAAEWLGQVIADKVGSIDRSSLRDREALVSMLVSFELGLRSAERAASREPSGTSAGRLVRVRQRVDAVRRRIAEALENVGLDDLLIAERVHAGLLREDPAHPVIPIPEPPATVRVRRLRTPQRFQGVTAAAGPAPALTWRTASRQPTDGRREGGIVLLAVLAIPALTWCLASRPERLGRRGGTAIIAAVATTAFAGPWIFAAAVAMTIVGWCSTT